MGIPALDQWLIRRMGWPKESGLPTPEQVKDWQFVQLRKIIAHAQKNSPFYSTHLAGFDASTIHGYDDFSRLPMISTDTLQNNSKQLLCVSQDEIARMVTIQSSGTTGLPKRIFNTSDDLEATVDFFRWGMSNLVEPGQTAFVLMPGNRPDGVGNLLVDAITRIGASAVVHGEMKNAKNALDHLLIENTDCIIGPSAHVNMIAREWEKRALPKGKIRSVLLCWDSVPDAIVRNAKQIFGCQVFRHWGMVETGLGGAVECSPGSGLHLRETDVFLEIVNPETSLPLPDGEYGEMIISTPLKRGMPLIRYRTGDLGRIMTSACSCGSPLRRLDPLIRRIQDGVRTGHDVLCLSELNEVLYALPQLSDFSTCLKKQTLQILACGKADGLKKSIKSAMLSIPSIERAFKLGLIKIEIKTKNSAAPAIQGLEKRRLQTLGE